MKNFLIIDRHVWNYLKTSEGIVEQPNLPFHFVASLNFFAVDNEDGTVEVIKNRSSHLPSPVKKSEFIREAETWAAVYDICWAASDALGPNDMKKLSWFGKNHT